MLVAWSPENRFFEHPFGTVGGEDRRAREELP